MPSRGFARVLALLPLACAAAQDPAHWRSDPERSDIRWTPLISRVFLSPYQRLLARIDMVIDGQELADRHGKGQWITWIEVQDSHGTPHSVDGKVDLQDFARASAAHQLEYGTDVFLIPDTYRISMAVVEPSTGKFSLAHRTLRVPPIHGDPLEDPWRGIPPIEFVTIPDSPDRWFLPSVTTRLHLPLANRRPARIEIVVNTSPSERSRRPARSRDAAMQTLLPVMRMISEIALAQGTINVTLLDILRHRITFRQENVGVLDWPTLKTALERASPNEIDVTALKERDRSAQFFIDNVARSLAGSSGVRVAIVLSAPFGFAEPQQYRPVDTPPDPDAHVVYLRLRPPVRATPWTDEQQSRAKANARPHIPAIALPSPVADDQLERTLKVWQPRIFDVAAPAEIRKALAEILRDVERFCR